MAHASRTPRRILHTSDLHIASLGDRACRSLEALVDLAIQAKVDLFIIVGDLFEHNGVDDNLVRFVVEQLERVPVDVLILPGNHDCLTSDSVYNRVGLWQGAANIRLFRAQQGETLTFPEIGVSVWGKPIKTYEQDVLPLVGIPQPEENEHWHIALAHGYYSSEEEEYSLFPSYHITQEEIDASTGWDYIALGHYPVFRCVCNGPVTYYCDSPTLFSTVNIVDLTDETGARVTRIPLTIKTA